MSDRNVEHMHYVPVSLLKHFTDEERYLHVYRIDERRWFKSRPDAFGYENSIYTQTVDQWLERDVEFQAGVVFKKVRNGDIDLSEDERLIIARFISWQVFRTRLAKARISNDDPEYLHKMFQDEEFSLKALETLLGRPLTLEEKEEVKRRSLLSNAELEEDLRRIRPVGVIDDFSFLLNQKMIADKNPASLVNQDVDFFMRLAWRVIKAGKESFILSDNPVTKTPHSGLGMDSPEFECVLPISKKVAIHIGRDRNLSGKDIELASSDKAVRRINLRTLGNAYQYVISHREDRWIKKTAYRKSISYRRLGFSGEIIGLDDVQYGRLPCQDCGTKFTSEQWDLWEGKEMSIRGYKGVPPHECLPEAT